MYAHSPPRQLGLRLIVTFVFTALYVTEVSGALGAEPLCFPRTGFLSTLHELNGDHSLYNQAPTTLAAMISSKRTMHPITNRCFGNNPSGIWPRYWVVGYALPYRQNPSTLRSWDLHRTVGGQPHKARSLRFLR